MTTNHSRAAILLSSVIVIIVTVTTISIGPLSAVEAADTNNNNQQPAASSSSHNRTKLQARILLETNNLDLDDKKPVTAQKLLTNSTSSSLEGRHQRRKKNRANENGSRGGGLSNIWSMFLPGSSAGSSESGDYDEGGEDSSAATDDSSSVSPASSLSNMTMGGPVANLDAGETEAGASERPPELEKDVLSVPKYSRPTRQEGAVISAGGDTLLASSSIGQPESRPSSQTNSSSEPVAYLTGAVTRPDEGGMNMNDIVSNLMSSMGNRTSSMTTRNQSSGGRGEFEVREPSSVTSTASFMGTANQPQDNRTSSSTVGDDGGNSGFERWLNKIQFQELATRATPANNSTKRPNLVAGNVSFPGGQNSLMSMRRQLAGASKSSIRDDHQFSAGTRTTANFGQHLQSKSQPSRGAQPGSIKAGQAQPQQQEQARSQQHRRISQRQYPDSNSRFQHPFQQQQRQHQSQSTAHGFRHPSAQASTISVSTQDGSSNTSLSFANNNFAASLLPTSSFNQLLPVNEISQTTENAAPNHRNHSSSESDPTNAELQQHQQQNVYQSQDEILRQVTSAINFEQQLNHKKREQDRQPNRDDPLSENNSMSKLLKAGSSPNDINEAPQSDTMKNQQQTGSGSGGGNNGGEADIDKSFDLLADKLRLLALQQQQQQFAANSSQPTWLRPRPSLHDASGSLLVATSGSSSSNGTSGSKNLDQLLELLSQHERNRNELKASQDSMIQLVQQLSKIDSARKQAAQQAEANADSLKQTTGNDQNPSSNLIRGEVISEQQDNAGRQAAAAAAAAAAANQVGPWTPVNVMPNTNSDNRMPASPGNMAKHRYQQLRDQPLSNQQLVISQMKDNVGWGNDFANDDYYLNNLSMMFASSPNNNNAAPATGQEKMFGLPIAVLKDDQEEQSTIELPPEQLEAAAIAAAEQLVGQRPGQQSSHSMEPFLMPRPAGPGVQQSHLGAPFRRGQQQHVEPIDQIQKLLQQYSPQTFTHGVAPRVPLASGSLEQTQTKPRPAAMEQSVGAGHPGRQSSFMASGGDVASLIHEHHAPTSEHEMNKNNLVDTTSHIMMPAVDSDAQAHHHLGQMPPHSHLLSERPAGIIERDSLSPQQQRSNPNPAGSGRGQDLQRAQQQSIQSNANSFHQQQQQQKQHQQQQQQQVPLNLQLQSQQQDQQQRQFQQQMYGYLDYPPLHPTVVREFSPGLYDLGPRQPAQMVTTTIGNSGLPVRIREVNLPRPFGFRSHHSVAYTASPAISALRAGLAQSAANRPGLLRHMSPLRATLGHGQRLLAPLMQPPPQVPPGHLHYSPYQNSPVVSTHYTTSPLAAQPFLSTISPYSQQSMRQLRRQSKPSSPASSFRMLHHDHENDNWISTGGNSVSAASKLKVRHMEPSIDAIEDTIDRPDRQQHLEPADDGNHYDGSFEEFLHQPANFEDSDLRFHQPRFGTSRPVVIRKPLVQYAAATKQQHKVTIRKPGQQFIGGPAPSPARPRHQRGRHFDLPQIQIDRPSLPKIKPTCEPHSTTTTASPAVTFPQQTYTSANSNNNDISASVPVTTELPITSPNITAHPIYSNTTTSTLSPTTTTTNSTLRDNSPLAPSIMGDI